MSSAGAGQARWRTRFQTPAGRRGPKNCHKATKCCSAPRTRRYVCARARKRKRVSTKRAPTCTSAHTLTPAPNPHPHAHPAAPSTGMSGPDTAEAAQRKHRQEIVPKLDASALPPAFAPASSASTQVSPDVESEGQRSGRRSEPTEMSFCAKRTHSTVTLSSNRTHFTVTLSFARGNKGDELCVCCAELVA